MSSEFSELVTKVRNADVSCFSDYLYLLETICGTHLFSKEKIIEVVGQQVFDTLNLISDTTFFNYSDIYLDIREMEDKLIVDVKTDTSFLMNEEVSAIIIKIKQWFDKLKIACAGATTKMAILQKILSDKANAVKLITETASFKVIQERLNAEITAVDQIALARSDTIRGQHVHLLFSDGEIYSTKGGADLFLNRSMFRVLPSIVGLDGHLFAFPNTYRDFTYVVFESEDRAVSYRKQMSGLLSQ